MIKKTFFFLLLTIFSSTISYSQESWVNHTTVDRLADKVQSIAIDSGGNKWFGTWEKGVSKFDGTNWTTYTAYDGLVSNRVLSIAIDSEGNNWFGTDGGISKFDGTNWTTYTTSDGLAGKNVTSIEIDSEGNKWFGTYYKGVSKFDGTNWTTYTFVDGLADDYVGSIAIDSEGNKWFGTARGVSKFDGTNWTKYDTSDGLGDNTVYSMAIDLEDNKWFGTPYGGVSKFDGTNWTTYTKSDGLADNTVISIAIDLEGNKWFGTTRGVSFFGNPETITLISRTVPVEPEEFTLFQNYPNPFNPETIIKYKIPKQTNVTLKIYNQLGQDVITLIDENKEAGNYQIKWDGRNRDGKMVSSGLYFYQLKAVDFVKTRKMIFLR